MLVNFSSVVENCNISNVMLYIRNCQFESRGSEGFDAAFHSHISLEERINSV